jgi:hypothetical protein
VSEPAAPPVAMRIVTVKGVVYIRAEDVAEYIEDMAGCEETDVRTRFEADAENVRKAARARTQETR